MRLKDKVAIITGGGGGMGRVAAQMFAAEGARVVVAEYSETAGAETVDMVRAAGGEATFVQTDVSSESDAKAMVDHAVSTYGRLDCLYNNAGVMPEADHSVIDTDVATWDSVMAVNVRGVFLGCKFAIPAMVEAGGPLAHAEPGGPVRAARDPDQCDLPGPGGDAASDGLAGQGRGGQEDPPGTQPDRAVRQARGDRPHGGLSRLGRIALDERGVPRRRRRDHRQLLLNVGEADR
jgi:NAD(P)-dependent dehydrogenase (short-subunit alcohol dehydrogenase family)